MAMTPALLDILATASLAAGPAIIIPGNGSPPELELGAIADHVREGPEIDLSDLAVGLLRFHERVSCASRCCRVEQACANPAPAR